MLHGHVRVAAQGGPDTEALVPIVDCCGHTIVTADLDILDHPAELLGPRIELRDNDRVTIHYLQFDRHRPSRPVLVWCGTRLRKFPQPLSWRINPQQPVRANRPIYLRIRCVDRAGHVVFPAGVDRANL